MGSAMNLTETTIRIAGTIEESIVDGPGLRYVLFTQGCPHHCPACHNPETHDPAAGRLVTLDWILHDIRKNPITRGITFSGGEPFEQSASLAVLARMLKEQGYHLTAFTGYLFEDLIKQPRFQDLLDTLDLLIDGPFVLAKRSLLLRFRGSCNQRILDVPASLAQGKAVIHPLQLQERA